MIMLRILGCAAWRFAPVISIFSTSIAFRHNGQHIAPDIAMGIVGAKVGLTT